ncbi:exonuclease domain-containing protein [Moraxella canis]|uniref:exonuclease domain-containing protein n=1 Tax=Moraxella canis TaxID=90239 RepID=UPI0009BB50CB|nr:exonuclease domain-containing protein [Moraxella canis]
MTHAVNHPKHYTSHPSGIECIEITRHMGFNLGNAVKYLWRNGLKDGQPAIQDLEKAIWYIQDEIDKMIAEENKLENRRNIIELIRDEIDDYLMDERKSNNMLFLDTETTGLDEQAQIIQLAIVDEDGDVIVNTYLDSDAAISPEAYRVHRIGKKQIKGYPYFRDIEASIQRLLCDRKVGMYNADFDMRMMRQSATICLQVFESVCVMEMAKAHFGEEKWLSLVNACKRLDIKLDNAHDAFADALATAKVYERITE